MRSATSMAWSLSLSSPSQTPVPSSAMCTPRTSSSICTAPSPSQSPGHAGGGGVGLGVGVAVNEDQLAVLIGATGWMTTSRLVRQEARRLLATDHLRAARALGVPRRRLLTRHVLPGLGPTLAAAAVPAFASAVPLETGLSFLGLGVRAPYPSWGNIIADADSRPLAHWWLVLFPTLAIALTVIAANAIAEGFARRARDDSHERRA